jgi:transposase
MVMSTISCPYCDNQEAVRRKGVTPNGNQRYKCEACKRSFQLAYTKRAYRPGIKEQVIDMALNGRGIRDTDRVLRINMNMVMRTIKKKRTKSSL